jgi:type I restriction and modification enzyme subunit R-like protein
VGESDTVVIATDFLADVLGYDKYGEITAEFVIRSTFCDLAIKTNSQLRFLIEVKAIGTELKENHLRQAVDYGANQGAEWVLLTNGAAWRAYRIRFEQPVSHDLVFELDLLDEDCKTSDLVRMLYLISREAVGGEAIDRYWRQKEATSRFVIGQLLLSPPLLTALRRELRRLAPGIPVTDEALSELLELEVLKRDVLEGDKAVASAKRVRRATRKRARERAADTEEAQVSAVGVTPLSSLTAVPVGAH